jgi:hypothetical protein
LSAISISPQRGGKLCSLVIRLPPL